ncbi:MAG TPA: c-type cytochrome [Candidatus Binatia bacterium]|nr:c-type cytochrome [Candidatus Binatia bacterium]
MIDRVDKHRQPSLCSATRRLYSPSFPRKTNESRNWLTIVALVLCLPALSYAQSPLSSAQDPLAGSHVFGAKGCSRCHSINGLGGKVGPDLGLIRQTRSFNDLAAAMWNHLPQMAVEMKKQGVSPPHLSPPEGGDLIAFLYTLNYFDGSGNTEAGKKLFNAKRCVMCHQIGGAGGVIGPSLDAVGQSASPLSVAAAMWNHGPRMSEAMRARAISRPSLSASELGDLIAYLRSAVPELTTAPVTILPGSVNEGRALFQKKQCIKCHSIRGTGGDVGPDLGKRGLHRNVLEFAAALWNKAPAMMRAMKVKSVAVPPLTAEEMADIVAYLRSFQYFDEPGNPERGRQLLSQKQCTTCHSVYGTGGRSAPDLARLKGFGSQAAVIAALWNHVGVMAKGLPDRAAYWVPFTADEMTHLMGFFERPTRIER